MFTVTIETDNPAVLVAFANAVKNTPPVGYTESKPKPIDTEASMKDLKADPVEVTVHAPAEKVEAAKAALNAVPEATVKSDPIPSGQKTEIDVDARRKQLRQLVIEVSKMDDYDVKSASALAVKAAGLETSAELATCPEESFQKAINELRKVAAS